jgi:hypothetical protein
MTEPKYDIFIAHAGADTNVAVELHGLLKPHLRPFVDSIDLLPGAAWDDELPDAQRKSRVTVVLISPKTTKAWYQREEIAAAIDLARNSGQRVVPVYLEGREASPEVPYGLRRVNGIFVESAGGSLEGVAMRLRELLTALGQVAPNQVPPLNAGPLPPLSQDAKSLWKSIIGGECVPSLVPTKLGLLQSADRSQIIQRIADAGSQTTVEALGAILQHQDLSDDEHASLTTRALRKAALTSDTQHKAAVMGSISVDSLRRSDERTIAAFFSDIFTTLKRDDFSEVNVLMPQLALCLEAVPVSLHLECIETVFRVAKSNAFRGGPAAQQAIANLPDAIADQAFVYFSAARLFQECLDRKLIRRLLDTQPMTGTRRQRRVLEDYVKLSGREFVTKYLPDEED